MQVISSMNWKKRKILQEKHRQHIIHLIELYGSIFVTLILVAVLSLFYVKEQKIPDYSFPVEPVSNMEIVRGDTTKRQVIFTFDGGSGNQSANKILDILSKNNIKGTFFLTGDWVKRNPVLVKRMIKEGHEVFNHTMNHPHLTSLQDEQIVHELNFMDANLYTITGSSTHPYFRPPYGDRDSRVLNVAARNGYRSVYWTVDALDWEESQGRSSAETKNIILSTLAPGNIYLMHLGDNITGDILQEVIDEIHAVGYSIVSLTQGL